MIRITDLQVTDGAVALFLASEKFATEYAKKNGLSLADIPYIEDGAQQLLLSSLMI